MPASIRPLLVIDYTMTAAGVDQDVDFVATRPLVVIGNSNLCLVADAASTTQLQRQALGAGVFNPISNALACAVAGTLTIDSGANALDVTQYVVTPTDLLRCVFIATNNTLNARHFAQVLSMPVTGA